MRFTNWLIVKAIIPKVSNRFFIYGFMMSKKEQGATDRRAGDDCEAKRAHRRVSGGQSRSKCAARVHRVNIELLTTERQNKQ